jgi:hypothetical protein
MSRTESCFTSWRTSSYSGGGNQCVEVAVLPTGDVAVRDSKNRGAGMHAFSATAWAKFVSTIKIEKR